MKLNQHYTNALVSYTVDDHIWTHRKDAWIVHDDLSGGY